MSMDERAIRKELVLPVDPARAFAAWTAEMASWWPLASHSVGGDEAAGVSVEGRSGGMIVETTRDGASHVWGTISVWDPPRRLVTSWHPGRRVGDPTELEVRFEPHESGSRLVLEHRGWESPAWAGQRDSYEHGWDPVLARYASEVAAMASPMSPGPA